MEAIIVENKLAIRLKKLREQEGLTQKRAADIFGITNFQLSRYENGQSNPDPDLINDFAKYYDVTTDYLLGRSDSKKDTLTDEEREMLKFFNDPETGLFFREMKEAPEDQFEEMKQIWEVLKRRGLK